MPAGKITKVEYSPNKLTKELLQDLIELYEEETNFYHGMSRMLFFDWLEMKMNELQILKERVR
jgi:hypothetical protein